MSIDGISLHEDLAKQPWQGSYLIQRLEKPHKTDHPWMKENGNPFAFGGGLLRGGLSKEGFALIRDLWEFDYMGASEFEWGAVPSALKAMAAYSEAKCLCCFQACLTGPAPDLGERKGKRRDDSMLGYADKHKTETKLGHAFVCCHLAHKDEVIKTLGEIACNTEWGDGEIHLKESSFAWRAIFNQPHARVIGGLELDNGWLYLSAEARDSIAGFKKIFCPLDSENVDIKYEKKKKAKTRG